MTDDKSNAEPQEKRAKPESKTKRVKRERAARKGGARGVKGVVTEAFWAELRELYEGGDYSQRDLVVYARSRGLNISQPYIGRRAVNDGWVKGSRAEEIRNQVREEIKNSVGEGIRRMLEVHLQESRLAKTEILHHFAVSNRSRTINKDHVIPAALLRQLVSGLAEAQAMEARAMGFDLRAGRPFDGPENGAGKESAEELSIRIMSQEEADRHQDSLEDRRDEYGEPVGDDAEGPFDEEQEDDAG